MYSIIHPIEPFDAAIGTEIKFTWRGNQIYKVRCIVKNNETGVTVYDNTESTMKQSYTIPTNSGLVNGVYYVVYITVFDVNNNESDLQDIGTPFYCFSKPLFNLSVSDGELIQTSAYKVGLNYSQSQGEQLDSYSFTLYTYQKTVFSSSGDIYNTSDMSYVISGLENAKQYYIRATGKTLHGITLDTGFILITISYTIAQVFNTLELNNKAESGAVEIKSNIVSAIGLSEKDVIYIGDEYADLRDNSVTFDEGFEVRGDFTKIFVFYEPERNKSIISFGDGDRLKVDIYYRIGKYSDSNGEKAYFELVADSCGVNYVMNSNYVDVQKSNYQQFALLVNRQGSYYDLEVVLISTIVRYSANADGSNMTETKQANSKYVGIGYMPTEILEQENLYIGTKDFSGNKWSNLTSWYSTDTPYKNLIVKNRTTPWNGLCQNLQAQAGEVYTLYGYVKTDTGAKCNCQYYCGTFIPGESARVSIIATYKNGIKQASSQGNILDGDFYWMAYTFEVIQAGIIRAGFENSVDATGMYVCGLKVVKGAYDSTVTWTPAPSDWVVDPSNYVWKPL